MVYWPSNYGHIQTENDDQRHQILAYPNFVKHPRTVRASPNMPGKASRFRFKHIWPEVAPLCHLHISWTTRKSPWLVSSIFIMSSSIRAVWQDKSCHWGAVAGAEWEAEQPNWAESVKSSLGSQEKSCNSEASHVQELGPSQSGLVIPIWVYLKIRYCTQNLTALIISSYFPYY